VEDDLGPVDDPTVPPVELTSPVESPVEVAAEAAEHPGDGQP
jgi:hypothetical protein